MSFRTYHEGLKIASDLANKAVQAESSLSSLSPLASPLPTLLKAFPLYISAAEAYSHLLASRLVPESEVPGIKKKWRLVLERAEKVKKRVEELGGKVGKSEIGDEGEEAAVRRRGGRINGVDVVEWQGLPSDREFALLPGGAPYVGLRPELAQEQLEAGVEWVPAPLESWDRGGIDKKARYVATQGVGADCSVVAGTSVCLEHNRRWGTSLAVENLYPQTPDHRPRQSSNGKHVVKLMLNGTWRSTVIDAFLPQQRATGRPLYPTVTCLPAAEKNAADPRLIATYLDCAVPLVLSAYFLTHGGYSLRGSNPAPDIYALTGWIPERLSFREGFQREKEWRRISEAWDRGDVLVTIGTGEKAEDGLVKLHAYAVLDLREVDGERVVEIWDPGLPGGADPSRALEDGVQRLSLEADRSRAPRGGLFTMSWDEVCTQFGTLNLNWKPELRPVHVIRHWSWPKPQTTSNDGVADFACTPRYRLQVTGAEDDEVWLLLSQHIKGKDTPMDDIALHVFAEHRSKATGAKPYRLENIPFANAQHVLVRYPIRHTDTNLLILPTRDRGLARTDFTLQAFSPRGTTLKLERISQSFPFTQSLRGRLSARNSGGHSGHPSFGSNPQYKVVVPAPNRAGEKVQMRISVRGEPSDDGDHAWNVKSLWGSGGLVHDVSEDAVLGDSGAYSYGMAYMDVSPVEPGVYTLVVSTFEPGTTAAYTLDVESTTSASITPIPQEGAGMFHRSAEGVWTEQNAAGRPSAGRYEANPRVEVILPKAATVMARAHHPSPTSALPLNITLFKRLEGGKLGAQVATSGPYADTTSGVRIPRTRVEEPGVYVLVVSGYEPGPGKGSRWRLDVWADSSFEVEKIK